jgi:hypothetical protein
LQEETYVVDDYKADPVTRAYENFYGSKDAAPASAAALSCRA